MKNILYYIFLLVITWNCIGCVSEYDPGIEGMSNILVVEGIITNGTTEIKLSRSVQLSESIVDAPAVNNAQVSVESDSGEVIPSSTNSQGKYYIQTGELDSNKAYRLKIVSEGKTYVSKFLAPEYTPPIDTMIFYKQATGKPIQTQITTTGTSESSRYYLWSFEEIWEIKSYLMATATQETPESPIIFHDPYWPYYYCWKYNSSNSILLGSSYKLNENKISSLTIADNDASSDRFSQLYYLKIKQNALRREAYDYYNNLKMNAESTGSIFGPTPSEMKGNMECVEDSSISVIGYIEVSMSQYKEQMHDSSVFKNLYERPQIKCPVYGSIKEGEEDGVYVTLYEYDPVTPASYYTLPSCMDCRVLGGKKLKPEWWPNDHI